MEDVKSENSLQKFNELIERCFVPQKLIGLERPCEEKDFREHRITIDEKLQKVREILSDIILHSDGIDSIELAQETKQKLFINLMLLIGQNNEKYVWNSAESVKSSKELLENLSVLWKQRIFKTLSQSDDIVQNIIFYLKKYLTKDNWKSYPAIVQSFHWILQQFEV